VTPEVEARMVAALGLARQGYAIAHVFGVGQDGVCHCPKGAACDPKSAGKHGGTGWLEHATRDPEVIRTRFLQGDPGYGVVAPIGSGLLTIDEDRPGALETLGPLPHTLVDWTGPKEDGQRGRHVFGRLPDGIDESEVSYQWRGGEIRVHGNGQVIGPYCRHRSGVLYTPVNGAKVETLPTEWVRALIDSGRHERAEQNTARTAADPGWKITIGRHPWLVSRGRTLRGDGLTGERLFDELTRLDLERCDPPLTNVTGRGPAEIREIVAWVMGKIDDDPPSITILADNGPEPEPTRVETWPEPAAPAAFHGVLGDIALAVAPHTEADPIGVLGTLLAMFGAACGGDRAFYQGSLQRTNLSILLVGETGFRGRKGTALDVGRSVFRLAYPELDQLWLVGVASGEAITGHLGRSRPEDRVLLVEPEFGRLLTIMNREGSTLSAVLRNAWDGVPLGHARARDESLVARHHVTLLGHITPVELRSKLTDTDAGNGFANRLLFLAVRRSRLIPFPTAPDELVASYVEPLHRAVVDARANGEMVFDAAARDRWEDFYADLAASPRLGLAGAVTGRHEAQVARLALVYALADRSADIGDVHLEAAIALADYARRSAVWALGDSTGNRHADVLRSMLADGEVGWKEGKLALGLRTAADMTEAVAVLVGAGLAEMVSIDQPAGGRARRLIRAKDAKGAKDAAGARADEGGMTA
jgi:Protein of unknown function (DUF3987)/Bifunctional DNA primase/polymerase, N-terminal